MNSKKCDAKSKRKNDIVFILALVILCAALGLGFYFLRSEGNRITVTVDGKIFGEYSLSENKEIPILGDDGECTNLLVIRDGKAYIEYATCPDGICVDHKPISRNGESIVCLPHRVVIKVHTSQKNSPDIIT